MTSQQPPPGWYPDTQVPGQLRFWDGVRWAEHTAPTAVGHPAAPASAAKVPGSQASAHHQQGPVYPAGSPKPPALPNWFLRHKVLSSVLGVFVVLMVIGALGGVADEDDQKPAASSEKKDDSGPPGDEAATEEEPVEVAETEAAPVDTDGDGVFDPDDFAPEDPKVKTQDDVDSDRDGVADYRDDFPKDPEFSKDTDGDGIADRLDAFPKDPEFSKDTDSDGVADSEDAFPGDPSRSEITLGMENALAAAENYLSFSAFSRLGLIDQLSSEYGDGYDIGDATWAVDQLDADWKEQAFLAGKNYLSFTSFSREGLIEQLSSSYGDKYTLEEATYAVNKIGL